MFSTLLVFSAVLVFRTIIVFSAVIDRKQVGLAETQRDVRQQTCPFTNISGFTRVTSVPVQSSSSPTSLLTELGLPLAAGTTSQTNQISQHYEKQNKNRLWSSNNRLSPGGRQNDNTEPQQQDIMRPRDLYLQGAW